MAFVYKSEREINPSKHTTGDLGPGQYLPQGYIGTKNRNSQVGFDSNTFREMKVTKDEIPGPGSYERDDKYEKFAEMLKEKPYKSPSLLKSLEMVGPENLDPFAIIINKEKSKDVAFYSKEKRFKDNPNNFPGPMDYGVNDPQFLVKNSQRKKNRKRDMRNKRINASIVNNEKSPKSNYRHISIPSKNLCYGFDVNEIGNLYVKDDPDREMRYGGDKLNSVGPGSYESNASQNWYKGFVNWNKMSKNGRNVKDKENNSLINSSNLDENNNISLRRESPVHKKIKYNLVKISNQGNQSISDKNERMISNQTNKFEKKKLFKYFVDKRQKLLDMKISKSNAEDDLFDKHILNQEPGPGYYLSEVGSSSFRPIKVPEKFQYFGSNSMRFSDSSTNILNDDVGPGVYFKDENKYGEENKRVLIKEKNNYFYNSFNLREEIKKVRSENIEDRVGINDILNQYKQTNIECSPGPGFYDVEGKNNKKSHSNISQFGSLQRRFGENNIIASPGPGSYIGLNKAESINSIKFPIRPKKIIIKKEENTTKEEDSMFSIKKNDNKDTKTIPGVGSYDTDIINSLGYEVAKKVNKFNHSTAPFNSIEKRFKNHSVNYTSDIGPGNYYKDESKKNILKNQLNNSPPFNIASGRDIMVKKEKVVDNGPGSYNLSSYFDWNKKSFNVQFI